MNICGLDIETYISNLGIDVNKEVQMNLFEIESHVKELTYSYVINKLYYILQEKMRKNGVLELFENVEMPIVEVLASMQYERNIYRQRRINPIW